MNDEHARVIVAMVTPFEPGGQVNYSAAAQLSSKLVSDGADGILISGTTGEAPTLTTREKLRMLEVVLDSVGEHAEVWMGTGTNDTGLTVELTEQAQDAGAHGIMLVTPYYNKPPQRALFEHFRKASEGCQLPVMIYNVPSRTGANIAPETVAELAEIDNVIAVKEASGDVNQAARIRHLTDDDFLIYSGDDQLTLPILSIGGWGVVSVAAHLVADDIYEMIQAYTDGYIRRAAQLHSRLLPLFEAMFITTNPIPVKASLNMSGIDVGALRLPLTKIEGQERERLKKLLRAFEIAE